MNTDELLAQRDEIIRLYQERNKRIKAYVAMRNLEDPQKGTRFEHGVTNFPMVACNLAVHLASDGEMTIRLATTVESPEERDRFSKAERALHGIIRQVDEDYRLAGDTVSRRRANANDLITKGSVFNLVAVLPSESGVAKATSPLFIAERWDPETCFPVYGYRGLRQFIHEYDCPTAEYEEKEEDLGLKHIDIPANSRKVKVTDYYDRVRENGNYIIRHAMFGDDQITMSLDYAGGSKESFTEIPVRGGAVFKENLSFIESFKNSVNDLNRIYSYLLEAARRQVKGFVVVTSNRDVRIVEADRFLDADFTVAQVLPGETVQSVKFIEGFPEMQSLLQIPSGDMQRGGFTFTLWGNTAGVELSGYAISQLLTGAMSNLGPFHNFLNSLDSDTCRDWLMAYKKGHFKPLLVAGNYNGRYDGFFHESFSRKDVPDFVYVEIGKPLAFPSNQMQKLSAMSLALPGQPLLDTTTALDEIWQADDPQLVRDRMTEDAANRMMLPLQVQVKMRAEADRLEATGEPGDKELAVLIRQQAAQMLAESQGQVGQRKGQTPERLPRPEQGGLQNQFPSEDMLRAQVGAGPVAINRPPRVQERLATMGVDMGRGTNARR